MLSSKKSTINRWLKRILDILLGIAGLLILSPVILVLVIIVWLTLGWPVIFTQARPGLRGKIFNLYKFRSMKNAFDMEGNPLPDEQRLTQLGKFMRASSLDELPEIINVLKGEMSWVGPRPLLVAYLDRYSPEQTRRHEVLPGITGWAQVNGRNALSWEEKFKLDVWYVDHQSFWLDIKILFMTVGKVFKREAINAPGSATAPEFMGSPKSK